MRKLSLNREVLTELSTDELTLVVAGAEATIVCFITDPCITRPVTGVWCLTRDCVE